MKNLWTYIKNNKLISIFNLELVLILLLPYSIIYIGAYDVNGDEAWEYSLIFRDMDMLALYVPLPILSASFQIIKINWIKITIISLLTILCGLYSFGSFSTLVLPMQDYIPSWGNLLMVTVGPTILLVLINELRVIKNL